VVEHHLVVLAADAGLLIPLPDPLESKSTLGLVPGGMLATGLWI